MPEGGWPVVHYMHGTGGDYESCRSIDSDILSRGMALLCIDQPLHGSRMPEEGVSELLLDFYSFNFLNPGAGRNGFIQGAADTLVLTAMVAAGRFDIDGAVIARPDEIRPVVERAMAVNREGRPFLIDAVIAQRGPGAGANWHPGISIAAAAKQ